MKRAFNKIFRLHLFIIFLFTGHLANATVVEFQTVAGNVQVNLFDETTPETVANFLQYVNSGAYANNVVHRSEPGFVIQAGGFQYNGLLPLDNVPTGASVVNEPVLSNVRGTIAMAKLANDPNSATSQWFFNMADNSANLDISNGGFTVFGQVLGDGMAVLDDIAGLTRFNMGGAATSIPLRNYTTADATNGVEITDEHLVIISDVVVIDSAASTNPDIVPVRNTLINNNGGSGGNAGNGGNSGSSGGGATLILLLAFPLAFLRRRLL